MFRDLVRDPRVAKVLDETGPLTEWYPDGHKRTEGRMEMGVAEGKWTSYWPNGRKACEGNMRAGHRAGTWSYWTLLLGKVYNICTYDDDGKLVRSTAPIGCREDRPPVPLSVDSDFAHSSSPARS